MSAFYLMQEAWEAAVEGDIERSFELADEAGVTAIDQSMVRRKVPAPVSADTTTARLANP